MRKTTMMLLALGVMSLGCETPTDDEPGPKGGSVGTDRGGSGGSGGSSAGSSGSSAGSGGSAGSQAPAGGGGSGGSAAPGGGGGGAAGGAGGALGADAGSPVDPVDAAAPDMAPAQGSYPGCPRCVSIFDGKTLNGWHAVEEKYDVFMDPILNKPVMRSTGASRGFLATDKSYQNFRFIFSNRLLGGGHAQNMLLWCQRDDEGKYPNNACGGIQYQPPGRSMWDYRPGQNKSPGGKTNVGGGSGASREDWSQCEILAKGTTGEFRVACCKLEPGKGPCKGIEILRFKDTVSNGGLKGPVAWQAHNGGHVIHWTDVHIEEDPVVDDLITTK